MKRFFCFYSIFHQLGQQMLKMEHCMETLISKAQSFHFMAHFLAMADLERARVCSSGLTKTFFNFNQFHQLQNLNKITGIHATDQHPILQLAMR